jgi:hypothetical protein
MSTPDVGMKLCHEASGIVDEAAPQLSPLPPPLVGGVDSKDKQHREHESKDLVEYGRAF